MSRYQNSLSLPMAVNLENFRLIKEGADLRNELQSVASDLKQNMAAIQKALLADPTIKQMAEEHQKPKQEGEENVENKEQAGDETNEGLIAGVILSGPAIIQGVGKVMQFLGKKFGEDEQNAMVKIGEVLDHHGHNMHHALLNLLKTCLKPLIFWMKPEKQEMVTKIVFMGILAVKIFSGSFDLQQILKSGELATQVAEKALAAIKVTEIVDIVKSVGPKLISAFGKSA